MKSLSRWAFLSAVLCIGITPLPAGATSYTFDVDNFGFGQGWFTIDLPDAWSGIPWGGFYDTLWLVTSASEGAYTAISAGPEADLHVPWRRVQVGFFNYPSYQSNPPSVDNAKLFTFTDRIQGGPGEMSWGGTNLQLNSSFFGTTPVEAVLGIPGVTLRQSEGVPDTGGSLLLLGGACSGLIAFGMKRLSVRA